MSTRFWTDPEGIPLEKGGFLAPVTAAYETYGELAPEGDNAILVCHALTGDAHPASHYPGDKPGWWEGMVGPGLPLDSDKYFIICSNVLGGCSGTTGPSSQQGTEFPAITVGDMVTLQRRLLAHLGVERLAAVVGGSLGGMQALAWALTAPHLVERAIVLGAPARSSAQSIAFNEVARQAIFTDPQWREGKYEPGAGPARGLAVARMLGMITYRSWENFEKRFGRDQVPAGTDPVARRLKEYATESAAPFDLQYQVASYLHYQGEKLVRRFDAKTLAYLTRAMDEFDINLYGEEALKEAAEAGVAITGVGIDSDILYLPREVKGLVAELRAAGVDARYEEMSSPHGHDAFLIDLGPTGSILRAALSEPSGAGLGSPPSAGGGVRLGEAGSSSLAAGVSRRNRAEDHSAGILRIGMLGFGTVGSGVARLIQANNHLWQRRFGFRVELERVLVRDLAKERAVPLPPGVLTDDPRSIFENDRIDLLVEVMGGVDPAAEYISAAIARGWSVVTANKELLARRWESLWSQARYHGVELGIEGAVAAGVPLLRPLAQTLSAAEVKGIKACLNGTCNFILRRMDDGGTLEDALAAAHDLGYAEPDPSDDISGRDAMRKGIVLSLIAFGRPPAQIDLSGIEGVTPEQVRSLAAVKKRLSLVVALTPGSRSDTDIDGPVLTVGLAELPEAHPLARLEGPDNAIIVDADPLGQVKLRGPGAGSGPTASAVMADVLAIWSGSGGHPAPLWAAPSPRPVHQLAAGLDG